VADQHWQTARAAKTTSKKHFARFYLPDGVPMPKQEDPAFTDWSWFPHGQGKAFSFTKVLEPLQPLRDEVTVISGLSHPAARTIHGHSNADQFLTGAPTGGSDGNWKGEMTWEEERLSNLYLTILQKLGVETESFADSTGTFAEV
jgi:hypothetical protein